MKQQYKFTLFSILGIFLFTGCGSVTVGVGRYIGESTVTDGKLKTDCDWDRFCLAKPESSRIKDKSKNSDRYAAYSPQTRKTLKDLDKLLDDLKNELAQSRLDRKKIIKNQQMLFEADFSAETHYDKTKENMVPNIMEKYRIDLKIQSLKNKIKRVKAMHKQVGDFL